MLPRGSGKSFSSGRWRAPLWSLRVASRSRSICAESLPIDRAAVSARGHVRFPVLFSRGRYFEAPLAFATYAAKAWICASERVGLYEGMMPKPSRTAVATRAASG